jgi:hypothetical protein
MPAGGGYQLRRMKFLQRPELWILLLLAAGVTGWVMLSGPAAPRDDEAAADPEPVDASAAMIVHRTTLERDFGNARLDIELRYRNDSPRGLILQPPDVRLLAAGGAEVPPFILPTERPPQVPAQSTQDLRLRYWLDQKHLDGPLTLDIRGQTAEVKVAAPFSLDQLENRKPKTWTGPIR